MTYDYLWKNQTKYCKNYFIKKWNLIFAEARKYFSITFQLVGSSKRNLVLASLDEKHEPHSNYDLDYQIIISKIKDETKFNTAKAIKDYFIVQFQEKFHDWAIKNSTTAITLINEDELFSFDVVICSKMIGETFKVIKRTAPDQGQDKYIWEQLGEYKQHRKNLQLIKGPEKWKKVRELYKEKKTSYLNDPEQKSYLIFIEAVKDTIGFLNL